VDGGVRTPWSPRVAHALNLSWSHRLPGCVSESTSQSEVARGEGIAVPESEGHVLRRPGTEACDGREGSGELFKRSSAIEVERAVGDGMRERVDGSGASRCQTNTTEIGPGQRRRGGEHVSQPERLQPRHGNAMSLDDPCGDRARTGHADPLPDDRSHAGLERVPGAGRPDPGPGAHEPTDDRVGFEGPIGALDVGVEVEDAPRALHHVDQAFPVR
jgi:hypothetical protein